jgi:hypothetical protein
MGLEEEIAEIINSKIYDCDYEEALEAAKDILDHPSRLEVVEKCGGCSCHHPDDLHPYHCLCRGSGEIVRDLTLQEAVKLLPSIINSYEIYSNKNKRVRVKP